MSFQKSKKFVTKPFSVVSCIKYYTDAKEIGSKIITYQLNKTDKSKDEKKEIVASFEEKLDDLVQFFVALQEENDDEDQK